MMKKTVEIENLIPSHYYEKFTNILTDMQADLEGISEEKRKEKRRQDLKNTFLCVTTTRQRGEFHPEI